MRIPARSTVETKWGPLAYLRAGSGQPVVLIHGSLVTADDMMLGLVEPLSQRYDVIAFDRPGHGGSAQTPTAQGSPQAQAEMIVDGWRALGVDRPIIIGHSFGGAVALCAALEKPRQVRGVLALAPICFPELRLEHLLLGPRAAPVAGEWLARTFGKALDVATMPLLRNAMFFPQGMPSDYAEHYPFAWATTPLMMVSDAKDSMASFVGLTKAAAQYSSCEVPVRFLGGTHDIVVNNAKHGLAASRIIPDAIFEWMPGYGHMLHHACAEDILKHVSRLNCVTQKP